MNHKRALIQYCKKISAGKIVACTKHIQACDRFLRDVERENTKDFPYKFDNEKADRPIRWLRLFKHTKGVLEKQHIEPTMFQKFIICNIYGWYNRDTGYRRFKKMYAQVARKNAKTQLLGGLASFELMVFLEGGLAEVYCAATTKEQANIAYNEVSLMLNGSTDLKGKWREAYNKIQHLKSKSFFRALSKEDKKTGDGYNPQCGIIDEYHAHETSEVYDVIDSGMGARPEPLLAIITTAGPDLDRPCYRVEYDLVSKLLDPENPLELDTYFAIVCELEVNRTGDVIEIDGVEIEPGEMIDDINDESCWVKANPIVATYPEGMQGIRDALKEAKAAPEKMRNFLTKRMNVWVNDKECGYMNLEKWKSCQIIKGFPDKRGETCYIGVDLSAKIDLTSVSFVFPPTTDKYAILSHSFIPETKLKERMTVDHMPFDIWERDGWLTCTKGTVVNYKEVIDYCINRANENGWYIEAFCIDPWGSIQISNDLIELGYEVYDITQGLKTLSEPTKDFRYQVYLNNVIHDGNPVLAWALGNAITGSMDKNENFMLDKKQSKDRIDPAASVINAWVRAMCNDDGGYNTSGMRGFDV
jgi:phage terminase large subunit-like protein